MRSTYLLGHLLLCLTAASSAQAAEQTTTPASVFKDCQDCPEMVMLPAGSFVMGTPDDELGRQPDEGPQHSVTFAKPFAISRYPVTAGELDAYLKASGVTLKSGDERPGRWCEAGKPSYEQGPRQPAVCIDYDEVRAYTQWLSKKTGKSYRMLSEAEREYGARAGSTGPFPFPFDAEGEYQISKHANTYGPKDGHAYSSPVGSYPANAFGVYDMHGNVYEWVADCWHEHYNGAPQDGSAWIDDDQCQLVQIRGNDWGEPPIFSRSGNRNNAYRSTRGDWLGFRVAREL
ncbi:Formylglycine-generating enzyme, required for sulfatase activity, contains SUMF1/FGE domain [Pseudomonas flavescens]|uniref:Formylglycine-generating enzyme, required for sulfatase activity, contains SUMF1/FGE domain n=1 Tax=Phytopseudomonas flavescens TaxID=29435 RepID=A0A1G8IC66_9GAMM|nr:formylglycine-generating enzyme family protein [Pseudomonas flavescens]SDI16525.1 Formylglycine-generating enzyme, required for sulfatase activity, contains SUMF1/FGE domain [Pseudomonas flavescens]